MKYIVTIELKVPPNVSAKDVKDAVEVNLPECTFYEYEVLKVEEKKK